MVTGASTNKFNPPPHLRLDENLCFPLFLHR